MQKDLAPFLGALNLRAMAPHPNAGAAALAPLILERETLRSIAYALRVTEQAVRNWASGACKPRYPARQWLCDHYGIALDSWERVAPSASVAA